MKNLLFVLFILIVLISVFDRCGCGSKSKSPPSYGPEPKVEAGKKVKLSSSSIHVGLWLFYEDCLRDVVYNDVPNGTVATLTGDVCNYYGERYFKIYLTPAQKKKFEIRSENLWVPEKEICYPGE